MSPDLFDEAQAYVLDKMEREVHPKFLRSRDGQQFLEALVTRDIDRRNRQRYNYYIILLSLHYYCNYYIDYYYYHYTIIIYQC